MEKVVIFEDACVVSIYGEKEYRIIRTKAKVINARTVELFKSVSLAKRI